MNWLRRYFILSGYVLRGSTFAPTIYWTEQLTRFITSVTHMKSRVGLLAGQHDPDPDSPADTASLAACSPGAAGYYTCGTMWIRCMMPVGKSVRYCPALRRRLLISYVRRGLREWSLPVTLICNFPCGSSRSKQAQHGPIVS